MKKIIILLTAMLTISFTANAMSYEQARNEALFLTDKMAYELNLTDAQYEAAYEINLDYLMGVTSQADVYGPYWERRNLDLSYILLSWQWEAFRAASYFFRPLYWHAGYWHFGIYARYPHRDYFYFGRPHFYATYRGGHSWHMNGGRSFYEHRRSHFSTPAGRSHFGMRDGWDRGDFRNSHGHSSTRITANRNRGMERGGNFRGERSGNFRGEHGRLENNRSNFSTPRSSDSPSGSISTPRSSDRPSGSFSTPRSSERSSGSFSTPRSSERSSGSFSTPRDNSRSSFSGSHGTGSARTSGSFSGSRSTGSSFSGSRSSSGSARTSGSFSGSRGGGSSARSAGGSSHGGSHGGGHMGGRR